MKITLIITEWEANNWWEYRCNTCGQIRLFAETKKPTECGNCTSIDLTIDRPGKLPTKKDE
jgi:DNA-directed RNA polymerase subunit RPC12/RpoP